MAEAGLLFVSEPSRSSVPFSCLALSNAPYCSSVLVRFLSLRIPRHSGRAILVTREEEAFRFNIDGKTIVLPDYGDRPEYIAFADGSDVTADFDIEIVGDHHAMSTMAMPAFGPGGVTIISGEPLDASTQESIKAVLLSVGRDDEVTFISHGDGSDGQVQMLRKRVEVIQ